MAVEAEKDPSCGRGAFFSIFDCPAVARVSVGQGCGKVGLLCPIVYSPPRNLNIEQKE
jgi:hypothetical protein